MKRYTYMGGALLLAAALVLPVFSPDPTVLGVVVFTLFFAAVATGWNILASAGYVSLGHGAFFGIGAYTQALLCLHLHVPGGALPFALLPLAGVLASAFAFPLGWMALRTRRQTFVVITIALFFILQLMAYNLRSLTNGSTGLSLPLPPWQGGFYTVPFYYVSLAFLLLALLTAVWVRASRYGLWLLAIRDDEERAAGLGVRTGACKLSAFVLSAWFAGVGGGISAYFVGSVFPPFAFAPTVNVAFTLATFLGGVNTLWGPLMGSVMLVPLQQYLVLSFGDNGFYQMIYGALFLIVLEWMPEGIVPFFRKWRRRSVRGAQQKGRHPPLRSRGKGSTAS